jgi:Cytochrome P460
MEIHMKRIAQMIAVALILMAGLAYRGLTPARAQGGVAPALSSLPPGYRDWRLITVAHEEGKQNDIRAILGNDIAFKAARDGKLPYPDGSIIARLAWKYVSSEENNKAFGQPQSFIAGAPTNVQFMVKDSMKYASTGGWSYLQFNDGKLGDPATFGACFACHVPVKSRDFVFNRYSP